MTKTALLVAPFLFATVACGGSKSGEGAKAPQASASAAKPKKLVVSKQAKKEHSEALKKFAAEDQKSQQWDEATCNRVAKEFIDASKQQEGDVGKALPSALYNAGVAYLRCGKTEAARTQFLASYKADRNFHRGRAQVALFEYQKDGDLEGAIATLEKIIRDARFQDVNALVSVAALQMERGNQVATSDGENDLERAKKNIQRALAIDDSYMPASNQLAIYYLEVAKANAGQRKSRRRQLVVAGAKRQRVNQQQLELAALVAAQAIQKDSNYAPIHNTAGLIQAQMDNFNGAVKSFAKARALDPKFFEAHMNYAAVNLSFRGFQQAADAYESAIGLQPRDYEAHLGLALAYRGAIDDANFDEYVAKSQKHLDECKKISAARAEAYYNEAILTQEFRAKASGDAVKSIPTLREAIKKYQAFITRAGSKPEYAEAVKVSRARVKETNEIIDFVEEGEKLRKEQEATNAKLRAEEAAADGDKSGATSPPAAK